MNDTTTAREYVADDVEATLDLLDPSRDVDPILGQLPMGLRVRANMLRGAVETQQRGRQLAQSIDALINPARDGRPVRRDLILDTVVLAGVNENGDPVNAELATQVSDALVRLHLMPSDTFVWRVICDGELVSEATYTREGAMLVLLEVKASGRVHGAYSYAGRVLGLDERL